MAQDYNLQLLMLVIARMTGCVMFNPIFGRKNIPGMARMGITLLLSIFSYGLLADKSYVPSGLIVLFVSILQQLLVGFCVGFVAQIFVSMLMTAGESMDMQMGMSMAKVYDPQSNISMPMTGSLLNAMLILVFFSTNSHYTLLRIFVRLAEVIPYRGLTFSVSLFGELAGILSLLFLYAVKLSLPLMAAQLIAEFGVGLIMRAVPQIDVFVINIQLKLALGFTMILILVPQFASFLSGSVDLMFDRINRIAVLLAG